MTSWQVGERVTVIDGPAVTVAQDTRITAVTARSVRTADGRTWRHDGYLWATGAATGIDATAHRMHIRRAYGQVHSAPLAGRLDGVRGLSDRRPASATVEPGIYKILR